MIKAVLLDMDGVLYDSMPLHVRAWQAAFKKVKQRLPARFVHDVAGSTNEIAAARLVRKLGLQLSKTAIAKIAEEKIAIFKTYSAPKIIWRQKLCI